MLPTLYATPCDICISGDLYALEIQASCLIYVKTMHIKTIFQHAAAQEAGEFLSFYDLQSVLLVDFRVDILTK